MTLRIWNDAFTLVNTSDQTQTCEPRGRQLVQSKTTLFCLLLLSAIGCSPSQTQKDGGFVPVANGFGFGQHTKETYPGHRAIWADFEYRGTNNLRAAVWPYLNSVDYLHITNNLAVFLGDKLWHYRNGTQGLVARVIAFEAPSGPPMDITSTIFKRWSLSSGVEFTNISQDSLVWLTKTNGDLRLDFGIVKRGLRGPGTVDAVGASATISWNDIRRMMDEVRKDGTLKKEESSGTSYLEIE